MPDARIGNIAVIASSDYAPRMTAGPISEIESKRTDAP